MRQLRNHFHSVAGLMLEVRDRLVQRVVHRPADERHPDDHLWVRHDYPIHPPSIMNAAPVTKAASSLAR